jgi:cytochrome c-type biogenesis protein CcmH/NrfG
MIFATNKFIRNMEIEEIGRLLEGDKVERAIEELKRYIAANPKSDKAYFMLGNSYRRKNDWKNAMTNYCEAIAINPKSPAVEAYRQAEEILNFYNHDLYNP